VPDAQTEWASLLLASLVEAGVRDAVISPGSRSTPLVWAAARTPGLRCHSLIDERSAGFFALGQARLTGIPSVLICTSGTAPSHYYPAVIEARESGLPLLVLSADRPLFAQHSGAHQTIDQVRLFGAYAPYYELGTPVPGRDGLLGLRRTAWQVVSSALSAPRGAVHLNFRASKPLEPDTDVRRQALPKEVRLPAARALPAPLPADADVEWILAALKASECPLLICGPLGIADSPSPQLVQRFVAASGCLVCPEATSQLRFALDPSLAGGLVCDTYEWLLQSPALKRSLRPDFVLQLGATPVSGALSALGEAADASLRLAICAGSGWPDSVHQSAQVVRAGASELLSALSLRLEGGGHSGARPQQSLWRRAGATARTVIDRHLAHGFGEAAAVAMLVEAMPRASTFAVGNSLPPRFVDRFCAAATRGLRVCSQRGASGIEGAIAGALGSATAAGGPLTLLLGDISFLHDVGSLWAADPRRTLGTAFEHPVVLVVLNNGGGRIFDQLPIARQPGVDLRWWTTPHALDLGAAAALFGVGFARACQRAELEQALSLAYGRAGVSLIEVVVEPESPSVGIRAIADELEPLFATLVRAEA
jgi:2-succinyl-5-enolpyruvyl-6-hydroxy-3-cyclohexene-1-carboxylate synthase